MFRTNWEWISKKKTEEHVQSHGHLLTCLQKTARVLQDRKNTGIKHRISPPCNFLSPYWFPEINPTASHVQIKMEAKK